MMFMRMAGQQEEERTPLEQFGRNLVDEVKKGKYGSGHRT